MIKNIVFDIGRVLVDFDPDGYLRALGFAEETVQALLHDVFGADWSAYDRGDYPDMAALRSAIIAKHPAYAAEIEKALQPSWVTMHIPNPDTAALLRSLKGRGYRIYLLSNLAKDSYDYISTLDFFKEIDGGVFSYQERVIKPDEKIYRVLLERYGLLPEETVFLDDVPANIEAARALGMHGVVFTDAAAAEAALEPLL